jgi:hypothetical protein
MARHQSKEQQETVERVMHEYKHGELRIRGTGPKVKNPSRRSPSLSARQVLRTRRAQRRTARTCARPRLRSAGARQLRPEPKESERSGIVLAVVMARHGLSSTKRPSAVTFRAALR